MPEGIPWRARGVTVATFPAHAPPRECSTWSNRFLARKATDPESLSQAPHASRKRNNAARIQAPDRRPPDNGIPTNDLSLDRLGRHRARAEVLGLFRALSHPLSSVVHLQIRFVARVVLLKIEVAPL